MKNLIRICVLLIIVSACSENKRTKKYPNGKIQEEALINDKGEKDGEAIGYYEDGSIKWKANYKNNKVEGLYVEYFVNGQIEIESEFKNGKQDGYYKEYFSDGKIKSLSNYLLGEENGKAIYYYHNGTILQECYLKSGSPLYLTDFDSLGNVKDKKHNMKFYLLGNLTSKDSIKIKEIIPGFISSNSTPLFTSIEKYGTIKEGYVPKMVYNLKDSCYYYTFPPQKDTGKYIIKTFFYADKKFPNNLDTIVTIVK